MNTLMISEKECPTCGGITNQIFKEMKNENFHDEEYRKLTLEKQREATKKGPGWYADCKPSYIFHDYWICFKCGETVDHHNKLYPARYAINYKSRYDNDNAWHM